MLEVYTHYDPPAETNVPGIIYLPRLPVMDMTPLPPCQLFDDLFFIGTTFVGVLVVKTTDGLVLIDSMNCRRDVEEILFPGMRTLGLKPEDIRAVLVTHGHFDHFGGAAAIHEMTGCQVLMSEIDAAFMRVCPPAAGGAAGVSHGHPFCGRRRPLRVRRDRLPVFLHARPYARRPVFDFSRT